MGMYGALEFTNPKKKFNYSWIFLQVFQKQYLLLHY